MSSRAPYQRLNSSTSSSSSTARSYSSTGTSSNGSDLPQHHTQRRINDADDPQAPWLTHLEYSVDPIEWEDDSKSDSCPICNTLFVKTLIGASGKHHCRCCGRLCCGPCSRGALELPGYDTAERVCEPCRKDVLALRTFLGKNQETLMDNVPQFNQQCIKFLFYPYKSSSPTPSHSTEIWLAENLLLLMYRDAEGTLQGTPISDITAITSGFASPALEKRKSKSILCCISSTNDEFAAKEHVLFSIHLSDNTTLDFEAPTPALKGEWCERLRGLMTTTSKFVQYHLLTAHYQLHALIEKEKIRLSPARIKQLVDKQKTEKRNVKNEAAEKMRMKYASKKK